MNVIYNFSPGPAMIPKEVLYKAQKELKNWNNLGYSVMEISHRTKEFYQVVIEAEEDLRSLLNISDNYRILFCQGGARGQFSAIPMNLLGNFTQADYINSGYWSNSAFLESKKYCNSNNILIRQLKNKKIFLLKPSQWNIRDVSAYIHYCPNETIDGISLYEEPNFNNKVVVGDFSSYILSRSIDINKYGLIYAGAQKNIGPSGITIVIIRKDLIGYASKSCPSILDYSIINKNNSMFNTPPTFAWYLSGLVFKWLKKKGGVKIIEKLNQKKSDLLYQVIDNSDFYINNIVKENRSQMNIIFHLINSELNEIFLKESKKFGLHALKGHSIVGGMRASIYNAMPIEGVKQLVKFMLFFEKKYG
ncbi:3-phosphoserine/phosphohydroxythreonine transaminase [Buchnera aphidicola (Aphis helianthi)]|uniref:Phosphoserine aminotransferase n=1 Tax=Buchnera aphidicola (Aphis helianthi) TaxID=2315802 RepID=A0A4D6XK14_9GAMM|nr:3-phosphoserine/phosphohydroxythreonine transaminase [Buchnera aphidicola]QCI17132.1 3-phosphoserine/phosphohydroxythreonine transaminase [Buchnera aphidicola (Aphis helianthi)]